MTGVRRVTKTHAIGAPFTSCHVERSETSLMFDLRQVKRRRKIQRFFASLRMTNGALRSSGLMMRNAAPASDPCAPAVKSQRIQQTFRH